MFATRPARRACWVLNRSLAGKIIAVIMGVKAPLLLAWRAVAYSNARTGLMRDIGVLADVVGTTSTAAVSFSDAKAATETVAVAVNKNG